MGLNLTPFWAVGPVTYPSCNAQRAKGKGSNKILHDIPNSVIIAPPEMFTGGALTAPPGMLTAGVSLSFYKQIAKYSSNS